MTPAMRNALNTPSVISSLADAISSPVSASTMLVASTRPIRKSSGTEIRSIFAAAISRKCLAFTRLSFSTSTLPLRSLISKRAISPFHRSPTNSIMAPSFCSSNWSNTKNCDRIASIDRPIALSKIVTGILRRRSTLKNKTSFGSNSKSSQEPR